MPMLIHNCNHEYKNINVQTDITKRANNVHIHHHKKVNAERDGESEREGLRQNNRDSLSLLNTHTLTQIYA